MSVVYEQVQSFIDSVQGNEIETDKEELLMTCTMFSSYAHNMFLNIAIHPQK